MDKNTAIKASFVKNTAIAMIFFATVFINIKLFEVGDIFRSVLVIILAALSAFAVMVYNRTRI